MAAFTVTPMVPCVFQSPFRMQQRGFDRKCNVWMLKFQYPPVVFSDRKRRRNLASAVSQNAEESFKKTVEVDRLIDLLRSANDKEKLVTENILAFNEGFWIRLAARTETCKSDDDKKDYEELAAVLMSTVDCLVHKTNEKIESATDVLKAILKPVVGEVEEIHWPPTDPQTVLLMERVLIDELFLEAIITAPEEEWNRMLVDGLTVGKGEISPQELDAVIKKRIERTLIRTEGSSYQQRVLVEYLKGIKSRADEIAQFLQGKTQ